VLVAGGVAGLAGVRGLVARQAPHAGVVADRPA
jgi:hypothetical protein